jgi:hypothetical protein
MQRYRFSQVLVLESRMAIGALSSISAHTCMRCSVHIWKNHESTPILHCRSGSVGLSAFGSCTLLPLLREFSLLLFFFVPVTTSLAFKNLLSVQN